MEPAANERCVQCGEALHSGANACPACGAQIEALARRPRGTIAILILLLLIAFTLTGILVRGFDARRAQLSRRWYARGERDLQKGVSLQAVSEFQTALAYSRDDSNYRLKLAIALMQAGRWDQARAHLLNLWEQRPGDGEVNLLLARNFAHAGLSSNTVRYYHGAIYGVWETNPLANREATRFELIDYLLSKGLQEAAQAELIALSAEAPTSTEDQLRLANLLLNAGEPQRALEIFQQVHHKERSNYTAVLGAAQAEFKLMRFTSALPLAKEAVNLRPGSEEASKLLEQAQALVQADPRARGISTRERANRAFRAFQIAGARLESCDATHAGDPQLQQLATDQLDNFAHLKSPALRDQDLRDQTMHWVYEVELTTAKICGAPSGEDATLLRLAQVQEIER
jgi:tetratricopeptide (TPR) repeat protein